MFEKRVAALEGGIMSLATSSGMAAQQLAITNIMEQVTFLNRLTSSAFTSCIEGVVSIDLNHGTRALKHGHLLYIYKRHENDMRASH